MPFARETSGTAATCAISTHPALPSLHQSRHLCMQLPNLPASTSDHQQVTAATAFSTLTSTDSNPPHTTRPATHAQLATQAESGFPPRTVVSIQPLAASDSTGSAPVPSMGPSNISYSARTKTAPHHNASSIVQQHLPLDAATLYDFRLSFNDIASRSTLTPEDKSHLAWAQDACQSSDQFSILFHQLFCLRDQDHAFLASQFGFSVLQEPGWIVFERIFGKTSNVSRPLSDLFATRPYSRNVFTNLPVLSAWIEQIKRFLLKLGQNWRTFCSLCLQRRFPPTAFEIIELLGCPLCFALCRALYHSVELQLNGIFQKPWLYKSIDLFKKYFQSYVEMLRSSLCQPTQANVGQEMVERFGMEYGKAFADNQHQGQNLSASQVQFYTTAAPAQPPQSTAVQANQPHNLMANHMLQRNLTSEQLYQSMVNRTGPDSQNDLTQTQAGSDRPPLGCLLPRLDHIGGVRTNPDPLRMALHQAHVWQPSTQVRRLLTGAPDHRLYQFVTGVLLEPRKFSCMEPFFSCTFPVSASTFSRIVKTTSPDVAGLGRPSRLVEHGLIVIHLRCVLLGADNEDIALSAWAAAPTSWPQHCFISLNSQSLELRRKRHHRRDLAVDISDFVRQGDNEIKASIHETKQERNATFALAVEIVEMSNEAYVMSLPTKLSKTESLALITQRTEPSIANPDIAIVDSRISIDVIDPFTAHIFNVPTRGKNCQHRECFDLKTYLLSRTSDQQDELTSVYRWNCPICSRDARPTSLVIDEFLLEVKQKLIEQGDEDVKAILVNDDGSWQAKYESPKNDQSSRQKTTKTGGQQLQDDTKITSDTHCAPIEIVDIDGD